MAGDIFSESEINEFAFSKYSRLHHFIFLKKKEVKPSKERLYDALGELIYAVAKADGLVQAEEIERLQQVLLAHPWSREIKWSFDFEHRRKQSVEEAYSKALETCKEYGPSTEYAFLFEVLQAVAEASYGTDIKEAKIIERFKNELKDHFLGLDFSEEDFE